MKNNLLKYNIKRMIYKVLLFEVLFVTLFSTLYFLESGGSKNQSHLMFKNPQGVWFLLLLIPVYIIAFYKMFKHNKLVDHLGVFKPNSFFKSISQTKVLIKLLLIRNILVFIIIALLHPIKGNKRLKTVTETMELVVALDISNSMNVKDISKDASRLDIAKRALNQLMNGFTGEKFGLCVFAGGAYAQLPLTNDYPVAKVFIDEVETGMLSNQGTNIAQAFDISLKMFSKESTSKAILMITDGENHEEKPNKIIKQLKKNGIKVAVLGIGTTKGGLIPVDFRKPNLGYRLDENGNYLVSKLNPNFLKSIAKSTSGFASITSHPYPNLTQLIKTLKKMKIVKKDDFETNVEADYYTIFIIIALIMFVIYFLISGKKMERKFLLSILILFSFFQLNAQSWNDSIVEARVLYKNGEYEKALKKYSRIKNNGPKSLFIDDEIAQCAYKSGDYKLAQDFYNKSSKSKANKNKAQSFFNLGNAYMKEEKYSDAINAYKDALRIEPANEDTRYNLSEAIRRLKQQQNNQNQNNKDSEKDKEQNSENNESQSNEKDNQKNESQNQNNSISNNTVDKILDNLSKQEQQTKQKKKEQQKGSGKASTGKDW